MMGQHCPLTITDDRCGLPCYSYVYPECLPIYRDEAERYLSGLVRRGGKRMERIREEVDRQFMNHMFNFYNNNIYSWLESSIAANKLDNGGIADALFIGEDAVRKLRKTRRITLANLVRFDVRFGDIGTPIPYRGSLHVEGYLEAIAYLMGALAPDGRYPAARPAAGGLRAWFSRPRPAGRGETARPTPEEFWVLFYAMNDWGYFTATTPDLDADAARRRADEIIRRKGRHLPPAAGGGQVRSLEDVQAVVERYGLIWSVCLGLVRPGLRVPSCC